MLKAWNAGKLGRALGAAGLDTSLLRRELARSEDALTSSVLGRVSYLPAALQAELLAAATPLGPFEWPVPPDAEPRWEFWPSFPPAPGDAGTRVEPDVLVRWGPLRLVIEVKHLGDQYTGQWRRELLAVLADERASDEHLVFLAVGGHSPEGDTARAAAVRATPGLRRTRLFQLSWAALHARLDRVRTTAPLDHGQRSLLADASEALTGARHYQTVGFGSLPTALSQCGVPSGGAARPGLATPFSLPSWKVS